MAQISIDFARALGTEAGERCADKAEQVVEGFRETAAAFMVAYLRQHGVSTSELMTDAAKLAGIEPHDDRAFGPVIATLARKKLIEFDGFCARRKGHGTAGGRRWKLGPAA